MDQIEKVNSLKSQYSEDLDPQEKIDLYEDCNNTNIEDEVIVDNFFIKLEIKDGYIRTSCELGSKINKTLLAFTIGYLSFIIGILFYSVYSNKSYTLSFEILIIPFVLLFIISFRVPEFLSKVLGKRLLDKNSQEYYNNQYKDLQREVDRIKSKIQDDIVEEEFVEIYKEKHSK
jgi:hypothetical protein